MKCPFSNFKDIFGAPGTGVHQYKFMGVALVDFAMSILFAMFITWKFKVPLDLSIISVLLLGILFHILFGVETGALKYMGITCT
jgi:hypothetical protein